MEIATVHKGAPLGNRNAATWTDERIEELKVLYATGASCHQIAAEMNCDITRNAVIGKVHRLGLTRDGGYEHRRPTGPKKRHQPYDPAKHKKRQRIAANRRYDSTESVETIQLRCVEIVPRHLTLMDLEPNDCRYPYGEGNYTFCGHQKLEGYAYCGPHADLTIKSDMRGINYNQTLAQRAAHRKSLRPAIMSLNREYAGEDIA